MFTNPQITKDTKLADLFNCAQDFDQEKADYRYKPQNFQVTDAGTLTTRNDELYGMPVQMTPVTFTRHALKQAAGKLGVAYGMPSLPTDYLLTLQTQAPEIFADNMNGAIERLPAGGKDWFVRTYQNECRARYSVEST